MSGRGPRRRRLAFAAVLVLGTSVMASSGLAQTADTPPAATLAIRAIGVADLARMTQTPEVQGPTPPAVIQVGASDVIYDDVNGQISALSSTLYPSDLGTCPTCLLGALGFPIAQQLVPREHPLQQLYFDILPALAPPYPLVTKAAVPGDEGRKFNPIGDVTAFVPTQGLFLNAVTQDASASPGFAAAETVGGEITVASILGQAGLQEALAPVLAFARPFVGEIDPIGGNLLKLEGARSRSSVVKGEVRTEIQTSARIARAQLLGGLIELADLSGSIVRSVAVDDPTDVRTTEHRVEIGPAKVAGIGVVFDGDAIRVRDARIPAGASGVVESLLGEALSQAGITVRLPGPRTAGASRAAGAFGITVVSGDTLDLDILMLGSDLEASVQEAVAAGSDAVTSALPVFDTTGGLGPIDLPAPGVPTSELGQRASPPSPGATSVGVPQPGSETGASSPRDDAPVDRALSPVLASMRDIYGRLFALGLLASMLVVAVTRRRSGGHGWGGLQ